MEYLHTMVRVSDLDARLDFYCDKLGLGEVRRIENEKGRFTLIFLAAPGDEERARSDAGADGRADLQLGPARATRAGAISATSPIEVDDIYATCQRLMDGGVTINRPPRDGRMAFVRSPDGISIELLQKGDGAAAAGAVGVDAEHRHLVTDFADVPAAASGGAVEDQRHQGDEHRELGAQDLVLEARHLGPDGSLKVSRSARISALKVSSSARISALKLSRSARIRPEMPNSARMVASNDRKSALARGLLAELLRQRLDHALRIVLRLLPAPRQAQGVDHRELCLRSAGHPLWSQAAAQASSRASGDRRSERRRLDAGRAQILRDLLLRRARPASSLASARATRTACVFEARSSHQPSAVLHPHAVDRVDLGALGREPLLDLVDDRELLLVRAVETQLRRVDHRRPGVAPLGERSLAPRRGCRAAGPRRRARRRSRSSRRRRRCGRTSRRRAARRSRPSRP